MVCQEADERLRHKIPEHAVFGRRSILHVRMLAVEILAKVRLLEDGGNRLQVRARVGKREEIEARFVQPSQTATVNALQHLVKQRHRLVHDIRVPSKQQLNNMAQTIVRQQQTPDLWARQFGSPLFIGGRK